MKNDANENILKVLLRVKSKHGVDVDDDMLKVIFEMHHEQQYEKERNTLSQTESLVEEYLKSSNKNIT